MNNIKNLINHILCYSLGHKKSHIVLAYSINALSTSVQVEVYEVSICSRCGFISVNRIDWYERCNWYASPIAKEEEKSLRGIGAVTLAEAYKELGK